MNNPIPINEEIKEVQRNRGLDPDGKVFYTAAELGATLRDYHNFFVKPHVAEYQLVVDINHEDLPLDLEKMKAAGVAGLIAKCSTGDYYADPKFEHIAEQCATIDLPLMAYHWGTSNDVAAQVEFASTCALGRRLALDFEDDKSRDMTIWEADDFIARWRAKKKQVPVLYGGGYMKDLMNGKPDSVLNLCPLWLAQYGHAPQLPPGWAKLWAWQLTGDGVGEYKPMKFDGCPHYLDVSRFYGALDDLKREFAPIG